MVLGSQGPGRVGRRRFFYRPLRRGAAFSMPELGHGARRREVPPGQSPGARPGGDLSRARARGVHSRDGGSDRLGLDHHHRAAGGDDHARAPLSRLIRVMHTGFGWGAPRLGRCRCTSSRVARSAVALPGAPNTVSIIGCDAANGTYHQLYEMTIDDQEWTLRREGLPFRTRFVARFADGGDAIVGRWETAEPGSNYEIDFELIYRRVT